MKKIWALFSIISLVLPLHGMQLQETGRALIPAFSSDGVPFKVEESVLEKSQLLKKIMENYGESSSEESYLSGPLSLGKSAEDFELILPLLQAIREPQKDAIHEPQEDENSPLQDLLSQKTTGNIARIVELANFFDVPQIIGCGSVELKKRLDVLCRQPQGNLEGATESFLRSMQPLTMSTGKLVAHKIIENHPAKRWLLDGCNISSKKLYGHGSYIYSICFSLDGNYLATGSGRTVKLWDVKTNQCVYTLDGHGGCIGSVCFSPDGNYLATGSDSGTGELWDVKTNQCVHTLGDNEGCIMSVCFSPDGNYLAAGSGRTVKLWDVKTNQCVHTLGDNEGCIDSVCFSPDGNYLATGSGRTVKLWDVKTNQCVHTLGDNEGCIFSVCFSPDGNYLATGSDSGTVELWDVKTNQCVHTLYGHDGGYIYSICFSPDGNYFATLSSRLYSDYTVKLWDIETGECVHALNGREDCIFSVCFSPDGNYLAAGAGRTVKLWDVGYFNELRRFLSRDLTLEQAVVLMVFYRNRDNESFGCPEYLAERLESLPDNIKKNIQFFLEEQKRPFYSRMMWRCKNLFSKVAGIMRLKNYSDQSSENHWWHFNRLRRGIGAVATRFVAAMKYVRLWRQ